MRPRRAIVWRTPRWMLSKPEWRWPCAALLLALADPADAQKRQEVGLPLGDGRSLTGVLFAPERLPAPAVIVLHTAYGRDRLWAPLLTKDMVALVDFLAAGPNRKTSRRNGGLLARIARLAAGGPALRDQSGRRLLRQLRCAQRKGSEPATRDEIPISSARDMKAALEAAQKKVSLVEYKGAFHRFDRGPNAGMRTEATREGFIYRRDDRAAREAFQRRVKWLKEHLK